VRDLSQSLFPPFQSRERYAPEWRELRELHLYNGPRCNRSCAFCVVSGSPRGWYEPFRPEVLDVALALVAADGNLKIYGGEPTLDVENMQESVSYLRAGGFGGWFTYFTNGVQADRVIALLEADERSEAVLNYSILHGEGAEPLPEASLRRLEAYARRRPGVLFTSHPDLVPVGPGATFTAPSSRPAFQGACPRCPPVLTSRGLLHACPFAVELDRPHYPLGTGRDAATHGFDRWRHFRDWIGACVEPLAARQGCHPCSVCTAL